MSKNLLNALIDAQNITTTENGAKAYVSTQSAILDLFAIAGAARNLDETTLNRLITAALAEDKILATKVIFYIADIRGGQGERRFLTIALPHILRHWEDKVNSVLPLIPHFSRWDLLIDLYDTYDYVRKFINKAFWAAHKSEGDKLIFKWLPTEVTHGKVNPLAISIARGLGITPRVYRKILTENRKSLNLVETALTRKQYDKIDYTKLPSVAGLRYRGAFKRHDGYRYNQVMNEVINSFSPEHTGDTITVNASTLYPHEIVNKYRPNPYVNMRNKDIDKSLEAFWLSMPDYTNGAARNVLVMADTSGSMGVEIGQKGSTTAYEVSVAMAIYFAEKIKGTFHNYFISFADRPQLNQLKGNTLFDKLNSMKNYDGNTNLQAAFDLVLKTALDNKLSNEDLPEAILIISDMQFDQVNRARYTNFEAIREEFAENGYTMPTLVFWNVNGRVENVPAKMNDKGVVLVSGYSPSVIKFILTGEALTPYEFMLSVINTPRYNVIDKI